jgi:hypothetical protein
LDSAAAGGAGAEPAAPNARGNGTGLLKAGLLQPGAQQEGFLFFRIDQMLVDWSRVRLDFL